LSIHKDGVFLGAKDDGFGFIAVSRRILINPSLVSAMKLQMHLAVMLAERNRQDKEAIAVSALNSAWEDDNDLTSNFVDFETDLGQFFESAKAGRMALAGPRVGAKRGTMTHDRANSPGFSSDRKSGV
jgi:hypothetical protein